MVYSVETDSATGGRVTPSSRPQMKKERSATEDEGEVTSRFDVLTLVDHPLEEPVREHLDERFWRSFVRVCAFVDGDDLRADEADRIVEDLVVSQPFYADAEERRRWVQVAQTIVDDLAAAPPFELATAPPRAVTGMEIG